MTKKLLFTLILTIFLLNIPLISAAEIYGDIYNINLDLAQNTILKINTIPEQTHVSKDGSYTFTINPGDYIISAEYIKNNKKYTIYHEIKIIEEGSYVLDLILLPHSPEPYTPEEPQGISYWWYVGIIIIIAILIMVFYIKRKPNKKPIEEDDLAKKVIKFIKEEGGRTTQKDIRKKFPMSEAKISLVITELEHKGKVKKIKKGRGNIIILN